MRRETSTNHQLSMDNVTTEDVVLDDGYDVRILAQSFLMYKIGNQPFIFSYKTAAILSMSKN